MLPGRKALDIACGEGRNSIYLAGRGYEVTGIDIADQGLVKAARRALEEKAEIVFIRQDLEVTPLSGQWDLIINFNFLLRDLIPQEMCCSPGGSSCLKRSSTPPAFRENTTLISSCRRENWLQSFPALPEQFIFR